MPNTPPNLVASGNIRPFRFVKMSGNFTGAEADANDPIIGVAYPGTDYPPVVDDRVTVGEFAAIAGEVISILGDGEQGLVELAETVTAGKRVKSDADGLAVAVLLTGTTRQEYGAILLEGGDAGDRVRCYVQLGVFLPAAA